MTQITIALTKGRILKETLPLLARAGIVPAEDVFTSRKLVFPTNRDNVRLIILRGSDVTTYVQYGAADLGVAGKDMLLEHQGDGYYEPLDLGIARCKLDDRGACGHHPAAQQTASGDQIYQCGTRVLRPAGPPG